MADLINLDRFKNKKKYEKVTSDLKSIIYIMSLTISGPKLFSKCVLAQETISVLSANKLLLEMNLAKLEKATT